MNRPCDQTLAKTYKSFSSEFSPITPSGQNPGGRASHVKSRLDIDMRLREVQHSHLLQPTKAVGTFCSQVWKRMIQHMTRSADQVVKPRWYVNARGHCFACSPSQADNIQFYVRHTNKVMAGVMTRRCSDEAACSTQSLAASMRDQVNMYEDAHMEL